MPHPPAHMNGHMTSTGVYECHTCNPRAHLQVMHNHLDITTDLGNHPFTWWPTLVLTSVSHMDRQCQVPLHWPDSWQLTTHSLNSLEHILTQTPVPSSDLTTSMGCHTYTLVPTQHGHL